MTIFTNPKKPDRDINRQSLFNFILSGGITYSTGRGIVLERMQDTFFEGAILPVINPYEALIEGLEESEGAIDQPERK